jgi:hypothetical protein
MTRQANGTRRETAAGLDCWLAHAQRAAPLASKCQRRLTAAPSLQAEIYQRPADILDEDQELRAGTSGRDYQAEGERPAGDRETGGVGQ